jgi:hypothetical protein
MKTSFDTFGQHFDRAGLRQTGRTLYQQMAVTEERDQHSVDQTLLADDKTRHVRFELLKLFYDAHYLITPRAKMRAIVVVMRAEANLSRHFLFAKLGYGRRNGRLAHAARLVIMAIGTRRNHKHCRKFDIFPNFKGCLAAAWSPIRRQ